jgi:predicted Zn-dependent peptidase
MLGRKAASAPTTSVGPVVERQDLASGARLVTVDVSGARSLAAALVVAVGVRDEPRNAFGLAELTQRMLLRGTRRRPSATALGAAVASIGGTIEAFVEREYSALVVRCAADYGEEALDILLDAYSNPILDPAALEPEKETLAEEARALRDTPEYRVVTVLHELLFGDGPLGRDAMGNPGSVRRTTVPDVREHVTRQHQPSLVVAGIAGAAHPRFRESLADALCELPAGAEAETTAAEARPPDIRFRAEQTAAEQVHVCVGVPAYPLDHPDRYVLSLLELLLGGSMSSRLYVRLRDRLGIAYDVSAFSGSYTDSGFLAVNAGLNSARTYEGIAAILAELRTIAAEGIEQGELERARALGKGRFLIALDDFAGAVVFESKSEALERQVHRVSDVIAGYDAVTQDDACRVASDLLDPELFTVAAVGPLEDSIAVERLLFG